MVIQYNNNTFINALINYSRLKKGYINRYGTEYAYVTTKYNFDLKEVLLASPNKLDLYEKEFSYLKIFLEEVIASNYISIVMPYIEDRFIEVFGGNEILTIGHILFNNYIEQILVKSGWYGYITPFGLNRSLVFKNHKANWFDYKLPEHYTFEQFIIEKELLKGVTNNYHCINLNISYQPSIFYRFDDYTKSWEMLDDFKLYSTKGVYNYDNVKYNTVESPYIGYDEKTKFYSQRKNEFLQLLEARLDGLPEQYERGVECFGETYPYVLNLKWELEKVNNLITILLTQY